MNTAIRNIQLVAVVTVLIATIIGFLLEIEEMWTNQNISLARIDENIKAIRSSVEKMSIISSSGS